MNAKVLKTLGKVHDLETGRLIELGQINDEFVRTSVVLVDEFDSVVVLEAVHHVVGVQQGELGRMDEAIAAEHLDVCPGDGQNGGRTERSGRDRSNRVSSTGSNDGMSREERSQVGSSANRAVKGEL